MTIKTFNTGRMYTREGQRIAYTITDSNDIIAEVVFFDIDRGISGTMTMVCPVSDVRLLSCYDQGAYGWCSDYTLLDQLKAAAAAI